MTPNDIVQELDKKGIKVTTRTLFNYSEAALIPSPERRGGGRGIGKITEYPDSTIQEFIASYRLINGPKHRLSPEVVTIYRKYGLDLEKRIWTSDEIVLEYSQNMVVFFGGFHWLAYRDLAEKGVYDDTEGIQYILRSENSVLQKEFNKPDENNNIKMGVVWK